MSEAGGAGRGGEQLMAHSWGDQENEWPFTARTCVSRLREENAALLDELHDGRERLMRFSPDFTPIDGTSVFIQWKGTEVCLDFSCECGAGGHFDGYFAYQLRCGVCGRVWDLPHTLALIPQQRFEYECIQDVDMDLSDS